VWRPGWWRPRRRRGGQGGGVRGTDVETEAVEAGAAAEAVVDSRWVPARPGRWTTGPGGAPHDRDPSGPCSSPCGWSSSWQRTGMRCSSQAGVTAGREDPRGRGRWRSESVAARGSRGGLVWGYYVS
jgi:hypothetical protein